MLDTQLANQNYVPVITVEYCAYMLLCSALSYLILINNTWRLKGTHCKYHSFSSVEKEIMSLPILQSHRVYNGCLQGPSLDIYAT